MLDRGYLSKQPFEYVLQDPIWPHLRIVISARHIAAMKRTWWRSHQKPILMCRRRSIGVHLVLSRTIVSWEPGEPGEHHIPPAAAWETLAPQGWTRTAPEACSRTFLSASSPVCTRTNQGDFKVSYMHKSVLSTPRASAQLPWLADFRHLQSTADQFRGWLCAKAFSALSFARAETEAPVSYWELHAQCLEQLWV